MQHVLIVEDDDSFAQLLTTVVGHANGGGPEFAPHRVDNLRAALDVAEAHNDLAAILLDLNLPDSKGLETLASIHGTARAPIVVVTGTRDESFAATAIRNGAHDLVVKGDVDGAGLRSVIRHAIARHRHYVSWLENLEHIAGLAEIDHLAVLGGPRPSQVAGRSLGLGSLAESAPDVYADLIGMYGDLLDAAIERSTYKEAASTDRAANRIARALGFAGAGPRDVVEVHTTALRQRVETAVGGLRAAYVNEGRNVLVQVIGYLATYYRARAVRVPIRPSTPQPDGEGASK